MPMRLINKLKLLLGPDQSKVQAAFNKALIMVNESQVYKSFCEKTHRLTFPVFNLLDLAQYEILIDILKSEPEDHFLDIGCGLGHVTLAIDSKTGKKGFGFDFSNEAINIANQLRAGRFFVGDYNKIDVKLPQTKLFISIDGFYFVKDFKGFFHWMKKISGGSGKLILLRTDIDMSSKLYSYLKKADLKYRITDLTHLEVAYWDRVKEVLPDFKEQFKKDKTEYLYEIKEKEMHKHLSFIGQGKLTRSLVEIEWS